MRCVVLLCCCFTHRFEARQELYKGDTILAQGALVSRRGIVLSCVRVLGHSDV